jgi:hypothetical protein
MVQCLRSFFWIKLNKKDWDRIYINKTLSLRILSPSIHLKQSFMKKLFPMAITMLMIMMFWSCTNDSKLKQIKCITDSNLLKNAL